MNRARVPVPSLDALTGDTVPAWLTLTKNQPTAVSGTFPTWCSGSTTMDGNSLRVGLPRSGCAFESRCGGCGMEFMSGPCKAAPKSRGVNTGYSGGNEPACFSPSVEGRQLGITSGSSVQATGSVSLKEGILSLIYNQERDLASAVIEEVKRVCSPADVFDASELKKWASDKGITQAREAVKENSDPEDVFDVAELSAWAEANGYQKKETT